MTGIVSYGAYIPFNRMKKETVAQAFGKKGGKGERAVAYCDEDTVTMAVAASLDATFGEDPAGLSAVFFASTTAPYLEKQSATEVAAALDLGQELRTADFANTLRAGSAAMNAAMDAVALEGGKALAAIADARLGAADGKYETDLGDAAAAFLFGNENLLATLDARVSVAKDAIDVWRASDDTFVRDWEVRYANTQLYIPLVTKAVKAVLTKAGLQPADIAKAVVFGHEEKTRTALVAKLGFTLEQTVPSYFSEIGNTGNASSALMLCKALDDAKPGDKILFVTYGEGSDAMIFTVTEKATSYKVPKTVDALIAHKDNTVAYGKFLKWKGLIKCEPQKRPPQERSSLSDYNRNYKKNHALYGCRCKECGTVVFPPQRVCVHCHAIDAMEPYRFYDKPAIIRTFTIDGLSVSLDSPNVLVVIEFEGGGKMMTYLVDCDKTKVHVGMKVRPSFRKMFKENGVSTYFWKVVPDEAEEEA